MAKGGLQGCPGAAKTLRSERAWQEKIHKHSNRLCCSLYVAIHLKCGGATRVFVRRLVGKVFILGSNLWGAWL